MKLKKEMEQMLTVEEIADIFDVSKTTVNNWINSDDLPALKVGMVRRIYIEDLKKFFEKFYTGEEIPNSFPISEREFTDARSGLSAMRSTTPSTKMDEETLEL